MQILTAPGSLTDVTVHDGAIHVARPWNHTIFVDRVEGGALVPVVQFPVGSASDASGFPRILSVPGVGLCVIYTESDGQRVVFQNVTTGQTRVYPTQFAANWAGVLGANGYAVNDIWDPAAGCKVYDYAGGLVRTLPCLSGQGFARLNDGNYPISNDANYDDEASWAMSAPQYAPRVFVGQNNEGGVGCVLDNQHHTVIQPGTYTNMPKVAKDPAQDRWAVSTTNENYQEMSLFYDISVQDLGGTPGPEPPIPPVPGPPAEVILQPGQRVLVIAT